MEKNEEDLDEGKRRYYPGFSLMRLILGASVVISHSFLIATGYEETEPFEKYSGEILGIYAVYGFFILSGFLVTESARNSPDADIFLKKRFRRIFPGFLVCNILCVYFLSPWFSTNPFDFIVSHETWINFLKVVLFQSPNLYLDNIYFYETDPQVHWLASMANGVLWTIRYEVIGYALIGIVFFSSLRTLSEDKVLVTLSLMGIILSFSFGKITGEFLAGFLFLLPSLLAGVLMNVLTRHFRLRTSLAVLSLAALAICMFYVRQPTLAPFFMAYPIIWLGSRDAVIAHFFNNNVDLSYGIYLYGWPVTQVVRSFAGPNLSGYELALLAVPPTVIVAAASWFLVERPSLRYKSIRRPLVSMPISAERPPLHIEQNMGQPELLPSLLSNDRTDNCDVDGGKLKN